DFLLTHLSGMNPLPGAMVMEPQKPLAPTAVGPNGSHGQTADFPGPRLLFEEFHLPILPRKIFAEHALRGQFRSKTRRIPLSPFRLTAECRRVFSKKIVER